MSKIDDLVDSIFDSHEDLTFYPIKRNNLYEIYQRATQAFWLPSTIVGLGSDRTDWEEKMTDDERWTTGIILAFFNISDQIVDANLRKNFLEEAHCKEARAFYAYQTFAEQVHSEVYSLLIDAYILDRDEKQKLFLGLKEFQTIKDKATWTFKWINREKSFLERLVAFAAVEGIFFSSSFAFMVWLGTRNIIKSAVEANEYIRRDEGFHVEFACTYYHQMIQEGEETPPAEDTIKTIIQEAVLLEQCFISEAFREDLNLGMTKKNMNQYVEHVANHLLIDLGLEPIYVVQNPFEFMKKASAWSKANFFEIRPTSYQIGGFGNEKLDKEKLFDKEMDF